MKFQGFQNPKGSTQIPVGAFRQEEHIDFNVRNEGMNPKNLASSKPLLHHNQGTNSNSFSNTFNSNQPQGKSFSLINKFQGSTQGNNANHFSAANNRNNNNFSNNGFNPSSNCTNGNEDDFSNLMTIAMLSPVCDPNWRIKARILKKNDIRQYKNVKGEGSFFSIEIMDKNQTEISCTFFNASCEKWFDFLVEGNLYIFSGGIVKENTSRYQYFL